MQSGGQTWFVVSTILLGATIFFFALWSGICRLLATAGGYRQLLAFRSPEATNGALLAAPDVVHFGGVRYRGKAVRLTDRPEGLGIHMMRMFVSHPDLCVPWGRVAVGGVGPRGVVVVLDGRVQMHVPRDVADAIAQARARRLR
jgi:hypothetical protein